MKLGSNRYQVTFARLEGERFSRIKDRASQFEPRTVIGRALGPFDACCIRETSQSFGNNTDSLVGAYSFKHKALYSFEEDGYASPEIHTWLSPSPVAGVTSLELDKALYTFVIPNHLIRQATAALAGRFDGRLAIYRSLGSAELVVLARSASLNELFDEIQALRSLAYSDVLSESQLRALPSQLSQSNAIFARTLTVPIILGPDDHVAEDIGVTLFLTCAPGQEQVIARHVAEIGGTCSSVLGYNDLVVRFSSDIPASKYLTMLHALREVGQSEDNLRTTTVLHIPTMDVKPLENYELEDPPEREEFPSKFMSQNPRLALRATGLLDELRSGLSKRHTYPLLADLWPFISAVLGQIELVYNQLSDKDESALVTEETAVLERMLDALEVGLSQRDISDLVPSSSSRRLSPDVHDGAINTIWALNTLIDTIFNAWAEASVLPQAEFEGLIHFDELEGFRWREGDIITIPASSVLSPVTDRHNWLTLTHELSHLLWVKLEIDETTLEKEFEQIEAKLIDSGAVNLSKQEIFDDFFELFACWYDYYHFYYGTEKYFAFVWKTWAHANTVHKDPVDYFTRSYYVWLAAQLDNDIENWRQKIRDGSSGNDLLHNGWEKFLAASCNFLDENFRWQLEHSKSEVIKHARAFFYSFLKLISGYKHDSFRKHLHSEYGKLNAHQELIAQGVVIVDPIENPFSLAHKLVVDMIEGSFSPEQIERMNLTLTMSLNNREFVVDS